MPHLYIIAGPNGAGKTTAAMTLLPEYLHVREFVNADEIARGLSPFNVEGVAMEAGRIMLERLNALLQENKDFAFETTMASKTFVSFIRRAQAKGYKVHLLFLWLPSVAFAQKRVASRVKAGGHNIPKEIISRRYHAGLKNLFTLYMPIVNAWSVFDNSGTTPVQIAENIDGKKTSVLKETLWQSLSVKN